MRKIYLLCFLLMCLLKGFGQTIQVTGSLTFCSPGSVTLTAPPPTTGPYVWLNNNLPISGVGNVNTYQATSTGVYSVVVTNNGVRDTLPAVTVTENPRPTVDFTFPTTPTCSGTNTSFTSNVTGGTAPYQYAWDFGDGNTSGNANPVHAFTSLGCGNGTFNVKLTVTDAKGCSNQVTKTITVKQAPDVQIQDVNVFSPFSNCSNSPTAANPNFSITVNNISPSAACISSYNINWGDGNVQNSVTFPISHTYTQLGAFNLVVTAIGTNCNNSKTYVVANQSNPAGSLGTLGSTTNLCAPANVPFTIDNWTLNSPGTIYTLDFGDGTSIVLNHPLNPGLTKDTINHVYNNSSCPIPSYTAILMVQNACDITPYSAGNIQIRIKPLADFTIVSTPSCVNQQVCFNNTTTAGSYGPTCSTLATYLWDFGDGTPTSTLENPCHTYTLPGVYNVVLTTTNPCGSTTKTKQVCITLPPSPGFTLSSNSGCIPFAVSAQNTTNIFNSCQTPTYQWSVTYAAGFCGTTSGWSFTNGTNASSANPSFLFTQPGRYSIQLAVTNACGTFFTSQVVEVKRPPTVSLNAVNYPCGPITVNPTVTVTNCGNNTPTYLWTFTGGTPASSTSLNPGTVQFNSVGVHSIILAVTNECGTTSDTLNVTVTVAPDVVVPPADTLCAGTSAGSYTFSSTVGNSPGYSWTNNNTSIGLGSSGTGNIPAFIGTNNGSNPVTATITVTPTAGGNCNGVPKSFTITVYPRPSAPIVVTPVLYCLNALAAALTATPTSPNTLLWYNNPALTGGSATAPTPATNATGTVTYYVTQSNAFNCTSAASSIAVTVNPGILGNQIQSNQNICEGATPNPLTGVGNITGGGGSYVYQWQFSSNGGTSWSAGPGTASYTLPALTTTTLYRRIVSGGTCTDTSNVVTITVAGALSNYQIAAPQTICATSVPALLTGQIPTGGGGNYQYIWEQSTDQITWTAVGSNTADYQPSALSQSTYFRRKVNASQCSATSNTILITVDPLPTGAIAAVPTAICTNQQGVVSFTASIGTPPYQLSITVNQPGGGTPVITQTVNGNGPFNITVIPPNSAPGVYTIVLDSITDQKGCTSRGNLSTVNITVKPRPILQFSNPPTICNGVTANITVTGATTYSWSPATGLNTTTGAAVDATPNSTITYQVTGTLNGCDTTQPITVTVIPGATVATAGPAQILCNIPTATLQGNNALVGTGNWQQVAGPSATITNAAQFNTGVSGLVGGQQYIFEWTITGTAPCPPTKARDTIDVLSPIINSILKDTVICRGESVTIVTNQLSGGSTNGLAANYNYQWEFDVAGNNNWQPVVGATSETLTVTPTISTCYRRKVKSNGQCEITSNPVCITVNPPISNNSISATQQICINNAPALLTGNLPLGGDGNFLYQWETSTDQVNWLPLVTTPNYQPAIYTVAGIYYFRRKASSGNCTSISNEISITVKPDALAQFTASDTVDCAPFVLGNVISVTPFPAGNGQYIWSADGGNFSNTTSSVFPGYTINAAGDTVLIQLIVNSLFGCVADTAQLTFTTLVTAVAHFVKDTSFGCGPLTVNFTNNSNLLGNNIQFFWNFGNGATSNLAQPGPIVFNSSPDFRDTTYQISLKAYNGCDTTIWRDSVKVRANPKARFGVDTTLGCSPFTVQITNSSLGEPNTYYWDFGNGVRDTLSTSGTFSYTYNVGNVVDTFTIRLIAENECRRDTMELDVRVAPNIINPLININSSDLFGCAPHVVNFINNTTGATQFTWDFGDGTLPLLVTNNSQSIVPHIYTATGTFSVSVQISNGCSDTTVFRSITVYPKPVASFTTNRPIYCVADTVRVTNNSTNATNFTWFWGDGTPPTNGNAPTHLYSAPGNYSIMLRAERTNASGLVCFDTTIRNITILGKPNVTLQTNLNALNCAPFTLEVTAPGIISETVNWTIYDSTATPSIINQTGVSASYTFTKPGTFYIKLYAINAAGCADSIIRTFTVRGTPVAAFNPTNLQVCVRDTTVAYLNNSTYDGTDAVNYRWLVDNIQQSVNGNFTYRYQVLPNAVLPRQFQTWLIASNTLGCSDTAKAILQMNPSAKASFTLNNTGSCLPFVLSINNTSVFSTQFQWWVNGVLVDTATQPSPLITQASTVYNIMLVANNGFGCKPDTFMQSFTTRRMPVASFRLSDTLGCTGNLNISTINNSQFANSYTWDWGDGSAQNNFIQPTHLYNVQGQYLVSLIASDGVCRDTADQPVRVSLKPVVDFSANNTLTCDTARVTFTNLTTGINQYLWTFSDGTFSTDDDPVKNFAPSVTPYTVKLVATNAFGCKDSAIKPNLILAKVPPASNFSISPAPVITVPNYTFSFYNLTLNNPNYNYQWSLGDGSSANSYDVIDHKYLDTGNYAVRLVVFDRLSNCTDTTIKMARIDGYPGYLYVPNAFYPNSIETRFKTFKPLGKGLATYTLQVFDSWGKLLFESSLLDANGGPAEGWDGTFKGKPVQQDAYAWRIVATFKNGRQWDGMSYGPNGSAKPVTFGTLTLFR